MLPSFQAAVVVVVVASVALKLAMLPEGCSSAPSPFHCFEAPPLPFADFSDRSAGVLSSYR